MFQRTRTLTLVLLALSPWTAVAAPATEKEAKLTRIEPTPKLLKAAAGIEGDFEIAQTPPAIDFAVFPGQWSGARLWSTWGDSLFASDGNFYGSIGDHAAPEGTAYVYRIDPKSRTVTQVVDYNKHIDVPKGQYTPGKIHGGLVDGGDGWMYFWGYRGSVRQTGKEQGYQGDWLLRYEMQSGKIENLGIPVAYASVPVLVANPSTHALYGLAASGKAAPEQQNKMFHYDYKAQKLVFSGGPEPKVARAIVVTDDGRVYYGIGDRSAGEGHLVRYDPESKSISETSVKIPGDGILRAASRPDASGVAYCITNGGLVFAFDTKAEKVREIGDVFVAGKLYTATCRLDSTGTYLYYVPGAHGRSSEAGTPVIQMNVKTGQRKVLAFLNEYFRDAHDYNLGGTYGIALSDDDSQLFINFNGAPLGNKQPDFSLCSAIIVNIPPSERSAAK